MSGRIKVSKNALVSAFGLKGRIVTMKKESDVINGGTLYVQGQRIVAILKKGQAIPTSLQNIPVFDTKGTIFPGMIELHNHLSYNCLPLWNVPKKYGNRGQWAGIPEYKKFISGPMFTLGKTPGYPEAIVRYVECKCLVAGVTTSQGIMLYSNAGIQKFYKGIVRNVEEAKNPGLPKVNGHIPDIAAKDVNKFLNQLKKNSCLLLHLSEGSDESAHKHFEALQLKNKDWAITDALTGIHCVALTKEDYKILKEKKASIVWSPLSNLLLYGQTASVKSAKQHKIKIGLGSDWSSSGSKNLLGELKVAKLYSQENGNIFSDFELISMATKNAAEIIKWEKELGTLEAGKRADLFVVKTDTKNPYELLLNASEKAIQLVVIDGVARYGTNKLMSPLVKTTETRKSGSTTMSFNLDHDIQDPVIGKLKLNAAEKKLKKALKNLSAIAKKTPPLQLISKKGAKLLVPFVKKGISEKPSWFLILDHNEEEGHALRPHLEFDNVPTMHFSADAKKAGPSLDETVSIILDPLTVMEDKNYFKNLHGQMNLPDFIKKKLKSMYQS